MAEDVSGEQLKALRLAAGLDVAVLARRVSLSTAQVLQLENDQLSLFYSPGIRRHAARKVLAHLGSQVAPGQACDGVMLPAASALADPMLQLPPRDGLAHSAASPIMLGELPIEDLSEHLEPAAGASRARDTALAGARSPWLDRHAGRLGWNPGWGWLALVLVAGSLSAWMVLKPVWESSATPASIRRWAAQAVGSSQAPVAPVAPLADGRKQTPLARPALPPQVQDKLDSDLVALAPSSSLPAPASVPSTPSAPARAQEASACTDRLASAPSVALKSVPDQVSSLYMLSSVGQQVCVLDGSGKLKPQQLEPGQVKGVSGPPPWTLQASSLQSVQLYFQGGRIRLPAEVQDRVQLVAPR